MSRFRFLLADVVHGSVLALKYLVRTEAKFYPSHIQVHVNMLPGFFFLKPSLEVNPRIVAFDMFYNIQNQLAPLSLSSRSLYVLHLSRKSPKTSPLAWSAGYLHHTKCIQTAVSSSNRLSQENPEFFFCDFLWPKHFQKCNEKSNQTLFI